MDEGLEGVGRLIFFVIIIGSFLMFCVWGYRYLTKKQNVKLERFGAYILSDDDKPSDNQSNE